MAKLLIIMGAPLWIPLLIAAAAVAFSLFLTLWVVIISLWCVFLSLAISSLGSVLLSALSIISESAISGITLMLFGTSVALAGLAIFAFIGCVYATRGSFSLTKRLVSGFKKLL